MANSLKQQTGGLIDHWLLNLAVDFPIPLGRLFSFLRACTASPETVGNQAFNAIPVPHRSPEDYAGGLTRLFDSGMIEVAAALAEHDPPAEDVPVFEFGEVATDELHSKAGVTRILERFLKLPDDVSALRCPPPRAHFPLPPGKRRWLRGGQVTYQLTERGGEAWEKVAEPDWSHILTRFGDSDSDELISPNRDLLMAHIGWYTEINHEARVREETIAWQTHTDYEILYWKRLPFVYHVSFLLEPAQSRWPVSQPKWFWDWWVSSVSWYKKPWDLSGWPSE